MSVDPKVEELRQCWYSIVNSATSLSLYDPQKPSHKWQSLASYAKWQDLLNHKDDWRTIMVNHYLRVATYEHPNGYLRETHRQMLKDIEKLMRLLDD